VTELPTWLAVLIALNGAGLLPTCWFLIRWGFRVEHRLARLERKNGLTVPGELA